MHFAAAAAVCNLASGRLQQGVKHPSAMMLRLPLALLTLLTGAAAHDDFISMPINPSLGVPGYPDCVRAHPDVAMSVEDAAMDLST